MHEAHRTKPSASDMLKPLEVLQRELSGSSFQDALSLPVNAPVERLLELLPQSDITEFFMRELAGSKHFKVTISDIFLTHLCQVMSRRVQGCCACVEMSFHLRLMAKRETLSCVRTRIWQFSSTERRNLTFKEEALRELGMPS